MKKISKVISISLCAALLAGIVSGCNAGNGGADGVETVTVWTSSSHSKAVVDELVMKFNSTTGKEKGIKIDYQVKEGDAFSQSIDIALQNGKGPDLFDLTWPLSAKAEQGYIKPVEELAGMEDIVKQFKDENLLGSEADTWNGKVYTLPVSATTQGLVYNKEMFKAAGIVDENGEPKPPETFAEMREVAKKLTNEATMEYGIILPMKWSGWYGSDINSLAMSSHGFEYYNPATGKIDYSGFAPIMEMYVGMKEDGSIFPGAEGIDNDPARARFASGKIGMKLAYSFDVGVLNDQFPAEFDWGVAPYPVADANNKFKQRMSFGYSYMINNATKVSDEKLAEVYKFFVSDEFIGDLYKNGVAIPYKASIAESIVLDDTAKKGWKEFCDMVAISENVHSAPMADLSGLRSASQIFMEDVWTGKITPAQAAEEFQKVEEKAQEQYYAGKVDETPDKYLKPDWNIAR